ncbi:MAG: hypothetical protein IJ542_02895 [Clostridia bacterium]|nr:hypothetical protein [Clostridia bacterium]
MIFSNKFAKIGRAEAVHIRCRTSGEYDVLLSSSQTSRRELNITGTTYNLGPVNSTFIYSQMKMLSDNLCVAAIDKNNFSIVEIE